MCTAGGVGVLALPGVWARRARPIAAPAGGAAGAAATAASVRPKLL